MQMGEPFGKPFNGGSALWLGVKLPFGHGEKSTLEPLIGGDSKKSGKAPLSLQWGRRMSVWLEHSGRMTGRISVREKLCCSCGDSPWGHSPLTVVLYWWFCNANGLMYACSLSEMVIRKGFLNAFLPFFAFFLIKGKIRWASSTSLLAPRRLLNIWVVTASSQK